MEGGSRNKQEKRGGINKEKEGEIEGQTIKMLKVRKGVVHGALGVRLISLQTATPGPRGWENRQLVIIYVTESFSLR